MPITIAAEQRVTEHRATGTPRHWNTGPLNTASLSTPNLGTMSISSEKYVSLVTLRKSGEAVASPVWIAPLRDGRAGFTTEATSGKVKRIRNNSAVTMQACNVRGKIKPNAPVVSATALVVTGSAHREVHDAIRAKYGIVVSMISIGDTFKKMFGKRKTPTAVVLTFPDDQITAAQ